ncbi:MAG: hypothetical protein JOZ99_02685 [Actinobacteria bacterium]|nr:hypothetical protein [Actinomycetota bacterium]
MGPDPERHAGAFRKWIDAGFDNICVVQVGQEQDPFFRFWRDELHPRLRTA